ncbi:MAG TPA: hypothetical protein VIR14_03350 [Gaiellaceae bacterium]
MKIVRRGPDRRAHTLGSVTVKFSRTSAEQTNDALLKTHAAAVRLARLEARDSSSAVPSSSVAIRRFAVVVMAYTARGAKTLLALAVAHLRRSEGWK